MQFYIFVLQSAAIKLWLLRNDLSYVVSHKGFIVFYNRITPCDQVSFTLYCVVSAGRKKDIYIML